MFTPADHAWVPERLVPIEIAYYRDMLVAHADDLVTGVCAVCLMDHCPDWRNAYDRLAAAGELMTLPQRYQQAAERDRQARR
jgi:hypothetical protein